MHSALNNYGKSKFFFYSVLQNNDEIIVQVWVNNTFIYNLAVSQEGSNLND